MPSAFGPLPPGTRLADRFLVVKAVGRGGMGLVYEALDEKLNRRVALKCSAPGHLRRLSPEARAARDISHFHICKVHDVHTVDTPAGTIDVLSMEFIDGETVWDRVTREGPLPAEVAYTITRQVCEGLGQAHRQGVIHGDLKGPNVMLGRDPEGQLRAVVTDFGLAQLRFEPDEGERGGTSAYMAPELLRGERPTIASDLYALGVVIHVMLTGRVPGARPAPGVPPPVVDSEQPTHTSESPRVPPIVTRVAEPLPAPWKNVVDRCLRDDPAERPASAEDVARAIEPRRWGLKAAAALAVAAMLALAYRQGAAPVLGPPVRLAVLPTTSMMSVGVEVAERLTGLRRNFTVIPPSEAASNRVDTPEKARRVLGATHALEMRLEKVAGRLEGTATLIDVDSGLTLRQLKGNYLPGDPPAIARAFAAIATESFRLPTAILEDSLMGAAAVAYAEGMGLLRQSGANAEKAMPFFERAVALAPDSARSYAGLAEAQVQRFINERGPWLEQAAANSAKARTLNADSVSVLIVSGSVAQERGQHEDAIRDLTRAAELEPSNSEAWRRLAISYERSNQPDLASATYQRAIDAQPDYYRHYLSFGNFYFTRGQYDRAEQEFRKVTDVAPGLPQGHTNLGLAFMQQGRLDEAERSLLAALKLQPSAALLVNIGALYYAQERYSEALSYFEQSLAAGPPTIVRYANLGDALRHLGRRAEADAAYRKGLALAEDDVTRNPRLASSRVFLGQLAAHLGDRRRAETELLQALALETKNASVLRQAILAYEVLGLRERSLALLASAPPPLIKELNRQPDVQELRRDARFQAILAGHIAR